MAISWAVPHLAVMNIIPALIQMQRWHWLKPTNKAGLPTPAWSAK
jgi:hypothetical protein